MSEAGTSGGLLPPQARGWFARNFPSIDSWVGNLGWPILLKQLRVEFRRDRYFYLHFVCVALLGAAVLVTITSETSQAGVTPTQVGQTIFNRFFWFQCLVVLLVFPVFSAVTFAEERARQSLDLLLITSLRPEEIVWGKFLASGIYCLLYILATVPILAVSFLFGGVTALDVGAAYAVLIGLTLLITMLGLMISSAFRGIIAPLLFTYVVILLAALAGWAWLYTPVDEELSARGNRTVVAAARGVVVDGGQSALAAWVVQGLWVYGAFTWLFVSATNRIRTAADNHATKMRVFVLVWLPLLCVAQFFKSFVGPLSGQVPASGHVLRDRMLGQVAELGALLFYFCLIFPTTSAEVSLRLRRAFGKWTGWRYPGRVVAPGSFWGFVFSVGLAIGTCGILWGFWESFAAQEVDAQDATMVRAAIETLPFFAIAFASLGYLLSVGGFSPTYARLTAIFLAMIVVLLPMIFYMSDAEDRIWNFYYASPIVLWYSLDYLDAAPEMENVTFRLYGVHIVTWAKVFLTGVTIACAGAAITLALRAKLPLLRFGDGAPRRAAAGDESADGASDRGRGEAKEEPASSGAETPTAD